MNVGEDKGKIVTDLIAELKPDTMVELGGYVGYSALLFGEALRKAGGRRYFSLERDPVFAAVVLSLVDLAGLSDIVRVIVGPSSDSIRRLHQEGVIEHIDLLFLDHYKPAYISDLKLCEQLGLVKPGTVLAADNVIDPGNPPYLEYVRSSVAEKKRRHQELGQKDECFSEHARKQYDGPEAQHNDPTVTGNPNLKYESTLVKSFEPTGVPVCIMEGGQPAIVASELTSSHRMVSK
jgi:catechol O-methyltransferase